MADVVEYSLDAIRRLIEEKKWEQVIDKCNEAILAIGEDQIDAKYFFYRAKGNFEAEDQTESLTDLRAVLARSDISVSLRFDCLVLKAHCLFSLEEYESCKHTVKAAFAHRSEPSLYQLINKCNVQLGLTGESPLSKDITQKKKSFRHDWYQNDTEVVISILIKNVDKEDLTYQFKENRILIEVKLPDDQTFILKTELFAKILFTESKVNLMSTKIDVRLKKASPGQWLTLEKDKSSSGSSPNIKNFDPHDPSATPQDPQKFPSSSKTFRDWDKLAADAAKEEAEEKPEGDAALNQFFQKIYGGGTDEQKKAMMKSFQESGGTVLSTNWDEVGKDKVKMREPDGMEFKKYDK